VPPEVLERATAAGCSSSSTYPFDIPQVHPDGRPAALPAAEGGGPGEAAPTGAAASTEGPASGKAAAAVGASQGGGGDPHPRHSYAELQELQQRRLDAHIQHQVEVLQEAVTTLPQVRPPPPPPHTHTHTHEHTCMTHAGSWTMRWQHK
jgi:hypothetical protein